VIFSKKLRRSTGEMVRAIEDCSMGLGWSPGLTVPPFFTPLSIGYLG